MIDRLGPAATRPEAAAVAQYFLPLCAVAPEAQDACRKKLIARALDDGSRLFASELVCLYGSETPYHLHQPGKTRRIRLAKMTKPRAPGFNELRAVRAFAWNG